MKTLQQQSIALTEELYKVNYSSPLEISRFLQDFSIAIAELELTYSRAEIINAIGHIRMLAAASPFIKRAQEWPRGYAGDFETIHYILRGENKATPKTFAYHIENFFLRSAICEQHRNKISTQAALIQEVLGQNKAARILSIGCGTSEDLHQCLPLLIQSDCRITLVDIDEKALEHSEHQLRGIKRKLTVLQGNIYKIARQLQTKFDLILIGGVFDYLGRKTIIALLRDLETKMQKEAVLFFTNIINNNPYRISMEYLSDWILIERSEEEIRSMIREAGINASIRVEKDSTGLAFLVTIKK